MEDAPAPPGSLPPPLEERYGGGLDLGDDLVFANQVSTLDGVVALEGPGGGVDVIGQGSPADRFLMGLLRASADCILVGAGTARTGVGRPWTAASAHRASAHLYPLLGRPEPAYAVVTASGDVDPSRPPLAGRGVILTTAAAAARLRGHDVAVLDLGAPPFAGTRVIEALRGEGFRRILVEAGPTLMGALVADRVLEELFLTLSPGIAGRSSGDVRATLVEGVHALPGDAGRARLRSVRAHGSHLFLRYAL